MKHRIGLIDRILTYFVERRLARFATPGDSADRFADGVVVILQAEIARRNAVYEGWDAEARRLRDQEAQQAPIPVLVRKTL